MGSRPTEQPTYAFRIEIARTLLIDCMGFWLRLDESRIHRAAWHGSSIELPFHAQWPRRQFHPWGSKVDRPPNWLSAIITVFQQAAVGFEPTNNGFAIRPLNPLGYAAKMGRAFYRHENQENTTSGAGAFTPPAQTRSQAITRPYELTCAYLRSA